MGKQIDNTWTEDKKYVTQMSLVRNNSWSNSANGINVYLDGIGVSPSFAPRQSMVVASGANTLTCTPTAENASADYWWVSVTDGKGHFAHGEVTDLVTPGTVVLSTVDFDYQVDWIVTIRVRKTGDTQDAVLIWSIANPGEDPTVAIPAGYYN